ncbi:MAG: hypothetical protein COA52_00470 [Hyphomicrobiales bacterium]|nr:MAG: hypothetical protein COA52_00470 [Hyphomicrobiales bacterium]
MIITGIGARDTPLETLNVIKRISKTFYKNGWLLRSGGAIGCDGAFESQFISNKEIFLPWDNFNGRNIDNKEYFLYTNETTKIIKDIHPKWNQLGYRAKCFHKRNVHQVLGLDLKTPSNILVCYTKGGQIKGGTATAIKLAKKHNIPVYNLYHDLEDKLTKLAQLGDIDIL